MQPQLLRGKITAVTGGLTGIGRAIALGFLHHGCNVAINYFGSSDDETLLEQLKGELPQNGTNFLSVAGDISNPETSKALIKEVTDTWGRLDIFVSNAGICQFAEFLDIEPDLLSKTIRTNLDGSFYAVQAAARQMASQSPSGGSIIGVSSVSALVGGGQQTHYTPTKAGILSLMQSCAIALGKHGIRCNALLPGTIKTQMNEKDLENEEKRRYMEGRIPLGRTGVTEDMVGPAVFLASDMSRYVTGAQLLVDGGLFVNLQNRDLDLGSQSVGAQCHFPYDENALTNLLQDSTIRSYGITAPEVPLIFLAHIAFDKALDYGPPVHPADLVAPSTDIAYGPVTSEHDSSGPKDCQDLPQPVFGPHSNVL
ncbi:MAG: hypothetical protein Q9225_000475 [Loekoesia sp. 1 TL-2023]